ncbi:MAG: SDR family oxidoreductase [Dehalococcoidia bacterium]|jgi:NAD(P)-dependent dehydrogenase (short-subunit alcohol dehydrogenase family)
MRLEGKVAIVTGAGSAGPGMGNGKATAILFAREGAKVVCVDRNLDAARETVGIIESEGGEAVAWRADVTKEDEAAAVVEAAISNYDKLNVLFNNVGAGWGKLGLAVSSEDWDGVMQVNLKSVLLMCKYAVPKMIEGGGGAIVNNASMAAFQAHPLYAYSVSKAGVVAFTRCLAAALAEQSVRVNCVAPGFMDTPMVAPIMTKGRIAWVEANVPMKRHGRAEETAAAVLFLASDEASYVTGHTICVDGGLSVR